VITMDFAVEANLTDIILQRVQNLQYPGVLRLSAKTLWQSGNPRYDLMQYLLTNYFHEEDTFFPSHLINTLISAQSNDEREQIYLKCFSLMGLCKPTDLILIQGCCSLEKNYKLLTQLLDLVETCIQSKGVSNLLRLVDKDMYLVCQVAQKHDQIFATEYRLFSNDMLSKLSKQEIPTAAVHDEKIENLKRQIETLRIQVVDLSHVSKNNNELVLDRELKDIPNISQEDRISRLNDQFGTMSLLIQRFLCTFEDEFLPWIKQTQHQQQTHDFDPNKHVIGKISGEVLSLYNDIKDLLHNLDAIKSMSTDMTTQNSTSNRIVNIASENDENVGESLLHELSKRIHILESSLERMNIEKKRSRLSTKVSYRQ
jgi:hypothetical protein